MPDQYFEGCVDTWSAKQFGFISYQNPSGQETRVFFPANSIRLDSIGRRGHVTFEGALVRFRIEQVVHKGTARTIASDVHPVFPSDEELPTSIEEHREVSEITGINSGHRSVWLRREDGSPIFLHLEQVIPNHVDRFLDASVGDYVYHGIRFNESSKWAAVHAELFSREENEKLQRGEALDAEPQSEPEKVPEILAPTNRSKTLLQLTLEKRARHEILSSIESKP